MVTAYDELIVQVAGAYALPINLLTAQVLQESSGKADAFRYEAGFYSRYIQHHPTAKGFSYGPLAACSYGLLQILLETALEIGFSDRPETLFLPRVGLNWGAKKMRLLWDAAGNTPDTYRIALQHYNGAGVAAERYAESVYERLA